MFSYQATCMGTGFSFQIEGEAGDLFLTKMSDSALEILEDANHRFSLYLPESEISQLVNGKAEWAGASQAQIAILDEVERWREVTGGYFDARVGTAQYDPSGLVKAWATQNAANFLLANGIRKFTINAGGDILLSPELQSPVLNRVGLSNLRSVSSQESGANLVLDLADTHYRAVATSGISERGEHIWRFDERAELIQVSVVGVDLMESDIWATAIISGGMDAWQLFLQSADQRMTALATTRDGAIFSAPGFTDLLARL